MRYSTLDVDEMYISKEDDSRDMGILVAIFHRQTLEEQEYHATVYHNKIGFSAVDAPAGTRIAKKILAGGTLSDGEMRIVRKLAKKYSPQLKRLGVLHPSEGQKDA